MNDELKKDWGQLEEGLTKAMAKLSEAIEKAKNRNARRDKRNK